ncbi:MAG: SGNH/GDSL hydrolase family protein [Sulfuritalea sp.]|nr:SGNH/GDSL hydrolase family protein [Sulfuritalea sp.]
MPGENLRHALATLALAPVLLVQGRQVRRRVPILPEPEGLRAGNCGSGPNLRLLLVGDSAAAGVGARTQEEALSGQLVARLAASFAVHWKLLAFTGATTADMLVRLESKPADEFDVVVTSLGVNDVTGQLPMKQWRRQQNQLVELLVGKFRARHVLLSGLPPMHRFPALPQPLRWYVGSRAQDFDRALNTLANRDPRCEFVKLSYAMMEPSTMATDGFHPGPAIYSLWATEVARLILQRNQQHFPEPAS